MAKLLTKRVATQNPAGGVNPNASPNVGQYGWTNSESAHVSQLIAYVNMAKEASESSQSVATFVGTKATQVASDTLKVSVDKASVTLSAKKVKEDLSSVEAAKTHVDSTLSAILTVRDQMHQLYEDMVTTSKSLQNQIDALDARVTALEKKP